MDSVDKKKVKTLEDLRIEANLQKSDVYKGVGVDKMTYERWILGKTLPNISKAVQLAKILKTPLVNIFQAFGIDVDGVMGLNTPAPHNIDVASSYRADSDLQSLIEVIRVLPDDQAQAVIRLIFSNKKDDGPEPSSTQPS